MSKNSYLSFLNSILLFIYLFSFVVRNFFSLVLPLPSEAEEVKNSKEKKSAPSQIDAIMADPPSPKRKKLAPKPIPAFPSLIPKAYSVFFLLLMDAAIARLTSLGFFEGDIRDVIYEILQAFDDDDVMGMGWRFIKESNYKMVVNMLEYKRVKEMKRAKKNISYAEFPTSLDPTNCFGIKSDEE